MAYNYSYNQPTPQEQINPTAVTQSNKDFGSEQFKIEEDLPGVGWYVYRFDKLGNCTHDYLQDDLEMAIKCAEEEFGVPPENWKIKTAHNKK